MKDMAGRRKRTFPLFTQEFFKATVSIFYDSHGLLPPSQNRCKGNRDFDSR
jgi:hypothetical protein